MKFRFVDKITGFENNQYIKTVKAISMEEFSLLERRGRKGAFPESLILQFAVESAALLSAVSSGFQRVGLLEEALETLFFSETAPGDVLLGRVTKEKGENRFGFSITASGKEISRGGFLITPVPLEELYSENDFRIMWEELYVGTT